jgi:hypothetical protein
LSWLKFVFEFVVEMVFELVLSEFVVVESWLVELVGRVG